MEKVSEYIKQQREARNVSLETLSKGTLISVATLKDIENGKFDKYKGDELYIKMYLKRIAEYLGIESNELLDSYEALTQEIHFEDLKKEEERLKQIEENKKSTTFVEKIGDTFKEIKPTKSTLTARKGKRVYEDNFIKRYVKYGLVVLLCVVIIAIVWYSIVVSRPAGEPDYVNPDNPTVEGNPDTTNDNNENENDEKPEEKEEDSSILITNIERTSYTISGLNDGDPITIEVTFSERTQFNLWLNNTQVDGASNNYDAGSTYRHEGTMAIGGKYTLNIWNLGEAVVKINGKVVEYNPDDVTVRDGVSYFSLVMEGE